MGTRCIIPWSHDSHLRCRQNRPWVAVAEVAAEKRAEREAEAVVGTVAQWVALEEMAATGAMAALEAKREVRAVTTVVMAGAAVAGAVAEAEKVGVGCMVVQAATVAWVATAAVDRVAVALVAVAKAAGAKVVVAKAAVVKAAAAKVAAGVVAVAMVEEARAPASMEADAKVAVKAKMAKAKASAAAHVVAQVMLVVPV